MNSMVSENTQAILLLTAPLIIGGDKRIGEELLTHGEYRRLARQLREFGSAPADLLGTNSAEILKELGSAVPADRIRRLLDRGFLVSQAIERWQTRAIWVVSRADPEYPKKIKNRLKDESPAVLYGCGQIRLLDGSGLAVVGSRHVDETLIDFTETIGRQCANAKQNVISGCAQGIDRAAMHGALDAGGRVMGVLADSLERAVLNRENRNWLLDEQLVLISPYDPNAGFNIGHAMQRNKVIYALADAALVVSAEYEKGGTWAGAKEQLEKHRFIPVYVRSTGETGPGLQQLAKMGAQPWPNPKGPDDLRSVLNAKLANAPSQQPRFPFHSAQANADNFVERLVVNEEKLVDDENPDKPSGCVEGEEHPQRSSDLQGTSLAADELASCVRKLLVELLTSPKSEVELASAIGVSISQMRVWLRKFVADGTLEKLKKPSRYALKQQTLLGA